MSIKLEQKLLSSRNVLRICDFTRSFSSCKTQGINQRTLDDVTKSFMKMVYKTFFSIFDINHVALKMVTCFMSYTGYASLVKKY